MACVIPSSSWPLGASICSVDYTQTFYVPPCESLYKNHARNPFRYAFPAWPSPYQLGFGPLTQPARRAFVRIRTRDRSLAIRCDAGKSSTPAEAPEEEFADFGFEPNFGSKPALTVGKEAENRRMGDEEERRAGKGKGVSEGSGRGSKKGEGCEEEEEAVAVIAGVLMEKFGPQIVREELEEGGGNGRNESHEDVKRAKAKGEEEGVDKEAEEADAEASAEDSPAATSRPTRVVSPASLLSLYRFFSSHLGISSPSTVASILASCPAILRSDPITDLLTHVHLLQSYGISHADIVHITLKNPGWLRTSLAQIQDTLEFLLARGVRRSRLGFLLRRGRGLICRQAHSMNLDILVERAGVPVDKLGVVLEKFPNILSWSKESLMFQLEQLSVYFTKGCGGEGEGASTSTGHVKQHLDNRHLTQLILRFPSILDCSPHSISEKLAILQSFTPPGTPSIASPVLRLAPTILMLSSETLLAKLQFFVALVGKEAAGRVVRSQPQMLARSIENLQGKMAVLTGLVGQENAVRAVAQFPLLLTSSEETLKESFEELVTEVKEAFEGGGRDGSGSGQLDGGEVWETEPWAQSRADQGWDEIRACQLVVNLVLNYPPSISLSWKGNLRHKVEYLKQDMGLSIMEMLAFPQFLGYSLDGRIRPRHVVLLSMGYVVAPHALVGQKMSRGDGRGGFLGAEGEGREPDHGKLQEVGEMVVCLQQFLHCTEKKFQEKYKVKL